MERRFSCADEESLTQLLVNKKIPIEQAVKILRLRKLLLARCWLQLSLNYSQYFWPTASNIVESNMGAPHCLLLVIENIAPTNSQQHPPKCSPMCATTHNMLNPTVLRAFTDNLKLSRQSVLPINLTCPHSNGNLFRVAHILLHHFLLEILRFYAYV